MKTGNLMRWILFTVNSKMHASQNFVVEPFLPIPKAENAPGARTNDFIFEPSKEELVRELMPKILNTQLFKAVLDANASEHGARMTAMDKATENANEILRRCVFLITGPVRQPSPPN